jgi:hypothetical protein
MPEFKILPSSKIEIYPQTNPIQTEYRRDNKVFKLFNFGNLSD